MAFYAYSPSAGGFLGKTGKQVEEMAADLQTVSATCKSYVGSQRYRKLLHIWNNIALAEGISASEMAYRWVAFHSVLSCEHNDAMIFNASSTEQLEETLDRIEKGPLSEKSIAHIDAIWETISGWS